MWGPLAQFLAAGCVRPWHQRPCPRHRAEAPDERSTPRRRRCTSLQPRLGGGAAGTGASRAVWVLMCLALLCPTQVRGCSTCCGGSNSQVIGSGTNGQFCNMDGMDGCEPMANCSSNGQYRPQCNAGDYGGAGPACVTCGAGFFCTRATSSMGQNACPTGLTSAAGATSAAGCNKLAAGYFIATGALSTAVACPANYYCAGGDPTGTASVYGTASAPLGDIDPCPSNSVSASRSDNVSDCKNAPGYYIASGGAGHHCSTAGG